jgi:hypothetical protein
MKIRITENQAKRLNLIKEDVNPLIKFEEYCKIKVKEINSLYNNMMMVSIGNIVNNEIDTGKLKNRLDEMESEMNDMNKRAYDYINNLPDGDLDLRIDRATDMVSNKLTSLQLIVMDLEKLQELIEEHNLTNSFSDIKPIDITNKENTA